MTQTTRTMSPSDEGIVMTTPLDNIEHHLEEAARADEQARGHRKAAGRLLAEARSDLRRYRAMLRQLELDERRAAVRIAGPSWTSDLRGSVEARNSRIFWARGNAFHHHWSHRRHYDHD